MEPWKDLSWKVVMVTWASSGIGRELCLDLAKAGCSIIAAARRIDRLKSPCNHINSEGLQRAFSLELDVMSNGATIEAAVQRAWDAFGRIDALINNAGLRDNAPEPLRANPTLQQIRNREEEITKEFEMLKFGHVDKLMEPWKDLRGKVVMVTGASSGIGRELCLDLAKAGCSRVSLELDVTSNGATIEATVQRAWDAFERIDALINNAGFRGSVSSPLELSEEEWDHTIKTNLRGAWLVSKYVCRRMRDAKLSGGSVINISSAAGQNLVLLPGSLAYASSKMALDMLTRMMALELGAYKIRVNSIAPGVFKSEITERLVEKEGFNNVILKTVPLRDLGTIDPAITSLVRYLIHESSEYVSGNIFITDGGGTLTGVPIFSSL
ncbi:hypothetical protein P3S68_031550 [Capsicum galapagoense]